MNIEDLLEPVSPTEFDHLHSRNGSEFGYVPPSLHAELPVKPAVLDQDYPFGSGVCQLSERKTAIIIKRYLTFRNKPASPDRDYMLVLLEDLAREHNIRLPDKTNSSSARPAAKKPFTVTAMDRNSADRRIYKLYSDGENMIGFIPGENKTKFREVHEKTSWDELFATLYEYMKNLPENNEKDKSPAECELIRMHIACELVRQFYEVYGYDDKLESEPCPLFIERKLYNKSVAESAKTRRFFRKSNQVRWTAWWTITYSAELFSSEEEFMRCLLKKFGNLVTRRGWRVMGVFEKGEENDRLHFHGFVYIPKGAEVGELVEQTRWSEKRHCSEKYIENTVFREQFGINQYDALGDGENISTVARYTAKMIGYMQKGGRVYYSRHIPSEFVLAVRDCDVVCMLNIVCKRPIKRYVIYPGAYVKTPMGLESTVPLDNNSGSPPISAV